MRTTTTLALALFAASPALAQDSPAAPADTPPPTQPTDLTVRLQPRVWYPALNGDLKLPGAAQFELEDVDLDDPEASPAGLLDIRSGDLRFRLSGFGFGTDSEGYDFDYTSVEAAALWRVWTKELPTSQGGDGVRLSLDLGAGARMYDLSVEPPGDGADGDNTWLEPIAAAILTMDILEPFSVELAVTAGAMPLDSQSSFSLGVEAAGEWRFTPNVGAVFGYRFLYTDLEDGDSPDEFTFDGSLAGLFAALTIRF